MTLIKGLTRKQTEILTGLSRDRLAYLSKCGIVTPEKFGSGSRSALVYSFRQVLELREIGKLRKETSLQSIRQVINFLQSVNQDNPSLVANTDKIAVIDGVCHWVLEDLSNLHRLFLAISGKDSGQVYMGELMILPSLSETAGEMIDIAKHSDVIDFVEFKYIADLNREAA
jgi:DNA-binding transcriptional MerR regulator